eukprot:5161921-Pyramimonas_sp.AAC.1
MHSDQITSSSSLEQQATHCLLVLFYGRECMIIPRACPSPPWPPSQITSNLTHGLNAGHFLQC